MNNAIGGSELTTKIMTISTTMTQNGTLYLLDLDMRLGEASGAGVAILLVRAALACHTGMATFAQAGVSGAGDGRNLAT